MVILGKDPLVGVLRAIIAFLMGILGLVAVAGIVAMVALPFFEPRIAAELAAHDEAIGAWQLIALIEGAIGMVVVLFGLMLYFFLLLWRILASVREGDPFVPINSVRLARMAWTSLAGHVWGLLIGMYVLWIESLVEHTMTEGDIDFDFGAGGLVLVLVLFVLARVFRQGTRMREDLEGTV